MLEMGEKIDVGQQGHSGKYFDERDISFQFFVKKGQFCKFTILSMEEDVG